MKKKIRQTNCETTQVSPRLNHKLKTIDKYLTTVNNNKIMLMKYIKFTQRKY